MVQQALHIFKKDARHLRFEIAGVLTMIVLFVVSQALPLETLRRSAGGFFGIWEILLPVGWCFLIARAVHAEPIPGDRQFWTTRPYSRASLLLAKAIFILAFVNLPFLIAQTVILKLDAFPILSNAGALLWEQLLVTAVVTLPALVLAAMTANMIQFVMGAVALGALAVYPLLTGLHDLGAVGWLARSALAVLTVAAGLVILWLQYHLRKTFVSLGVAASGILVGLALIVFGPWASAFPIQSHVAEPLRSSLRVELRPLDKSAQRWLMPKGYSALSVPLRITGTPENTLLRCEGAQITITASSGTAWKGPTSFNTPLRQTGDTWVIQRSIDRGFLETHREERVHIHGTLSLTIFGNPRSTDLSMETPTAVPGVGQCVVLPREPAPARETDIQYFLCLAALRWPRLLVTGHAKDRATGETFSADLSYSPFPADFRLSPVESNLGLVAAAETITITTQEPLAHVRSEFDARNIRLGDLEVLNTPY